MDIDAKLAAYRLRKKREKQVETTKKVLCDIASLNFLKTESRSSSSSFGMSKAEDFMHRVDNNPPETERSSNGVGERFKYFRRVNFILYFLLWVTVFIIAIELEFGIVYIILSLLLFIWLNTRTGPKAPGEVSAYSVFNPNCEAIDGTLNAEQFESELRYGAISVH